jgi:3-carboxy-cis,cis-muconate cycloisomerase
MTNAMLQSDLFGALFRDDRIASEFGQDALLGRMLAFERAWTGALVTAGAVTQSDAEAATSAIDGFDAAGFRPESDRDGLPVPSLVAALRVGLAPAAAQAVHSGATSQDVIDTAMVLTALAVLNEMEERLDRVLLALALCEQRFGAAPLVARTRMQAALPARVSLRLGGWARGVQSARDRLPALRDEIGKLQLGGAIGTRDFPAAEEMVGHMAHALGLRAVPVWHTDRSSMVSLGHWFTLVAGAMGKIAQDVALMAQQGVEEIVLAGGGGSSAMPHKQNPILAETIIALARHVAGLQGNLAQAMIHEQERSGTAWALEWLTVPQMAEATGAGLRHMERLLGAIERIGAPG